MTAAVILSLIAQYGPMVISAAAAAAAVLPQGKDGSAWSFIRKGIDFLALNIGNAKNAKKS